MSDFVALLQAVFIVVAVGFTFTLLGAYGLVWLAKCLDRWLD